MKPSNLAAVALLSMLFGSLSSAQGGKRSETIDYAGAKFLPVHWVLSVTDHGKVVMLEDSSVWRICPFTSSSACRLWPGFLISIEERGSTYNYPYRLVISNGCGGSYPLNAACVKDSERETAGGIEHSSNAPMRRSSCSESFSHEAD